MIKIEVTGASIPEVADKLIAIGRSLHNTSVNDADNAAREALQAKRDAAKVEVAEAAPEDPTPAPAPEEDTTPSQPFTETEPEKSAAPSASVSDLNFDTDVAPIVLQVVKEKGKPVAQEILAQFGVEKASLLDPAQWPELVSLLKEQL